MKGKFNYVTIQSFNVWNDKPKKKQGVDPVGSVDFWKPDPFPDPI